MLQPFHTSSNLASVTYFAFAVAVCARVFMSASFGILTLEQGYFWLIFQQQTIFLMKVWWFLHAEFV